MIITDELDSSKAKPAAETASGEPSWSNTEAPPPYWSSQETDPVFQNSPTPKRHGKAARKRFLEAFACAAVVWTAACALFSSLNLFRRMERPPLRVDPGKFFPGENVIDCVRAGEWAIQTHRPQVGDGPHMLYASAELDLPRSTEGIFLLSKGSTSSGSLTVETSEDITSVRVKFNASLGRRTREAIGDAEVCLLKREDQNYGVGMFASSGSFDAEEVFTSVVLQLPTSPSSSTHYTHFETNLPRFEHRFRGLGNTIFFGNMTLRSSGAPISILNPLHVELADIFTSNAPILGSLRSSRHLSLETTHAPIEIELEMRSDTYDSASRARLRTTDSPITAVVRLLSSGFGSNFDLETSSTKNYSSVAILQAPLDPILRINMTDSKTRTSLPSSFEGRWQMHSNTSILYMGPGQDPTGGGRTRHEKASPTNSHGKVWWGDQPSIACESSLVELWGNQQAALMIGMS
ncbi:hypothetical protein BD410DRAFT_826412 [Rickenella mellea]|uniref:Uncharacterized protein n=1 Tax=Rickenella mellea TaxID=50990 RepID=A0A4Y7QDR4_9AGAM|nr:hypothetical protein BD410DRAFT_826412 [Rickenella mellea]